MSGPERISPLRRGLLKSLPLIPLLGGAREATAGTTAAAGQGQGPTFFTQDEWAFLRAAVARLIPNDDLGPGAVEAGVPEYIDRQMATDYASGALWYLQGPFQPDAPKEMGYQLRLNPREIYRLGIQAVNQWCQDNHQQVFARLDPTTQDAVLGQLEKGEAKFDALPAPVFFSQLLQHAREGFFADPIHGGNRGLVGWKLIGFPGARADYMDWVERGERYPYPPVSIHGERG